MMTREQRIEYEILSCALHDSVHREGYATTVSRLTTRLRPCFPTMNYQEITQACRRLFQQQALDLRKLKGFPPILSFLDFREMRADDATFFDDVEAVFYLRPAKFSRTYFSALSKYLEAPPGAKPPLPHKS